MNKEVCKKCCDIDLIKWDKDDDENWERGLICCPQLITDLNAKVNEDPPGWCPYVLEHTVSESKC